MEYKIIISTMTLAHELQYDFVDILDIIGVHLA